MAVYFEIDDGGLAKACGSLAETLRSRKPQIAILEEIAGTTSLNFDDQGLSLDGIPWKPLSAAYAQWKKDNGFGVRIGERTGAMKGGFERGWEGEVGIYGNTVKYAAGFDHFRPLIGQSPAYIEAYKEAFLDSLRDAVGEAK